MNRLVGVRWGDLKEEVRQRLFENSTIWDDVQDGECIYDLTSDLAVRGYVKCINKEEGDYEYIIEDDAIIYDPSEGIVERPKKVVLKINEVMTFAEATERWGLADSTLRKLATTNKLLEGLDFRKSGKVWLITRDAMERTYGDEKCHKE